MGESVFEREARALVAAHGTLMRETQKSALYRIGETIVGLPMGKTDDVRTWRNTLGDVRRACRANGYRVKEEDEVVSEDTSVQATVETTTPAELTTRKRVEDAYYKVLDGHVKLPEKYAECRHGLVDNVVYVFSSFVTGMYYMVDVQSAAFYRTVAPKTPRRFMASTPREVIAQDRDWLTRALREHAPAVLQRYSSSPTTTEKVEPPKSQPVATTPDASLTALFRGVEPPRKETKRIVIETTTESQDFGPHLVAAALKACGVRVPDDASFSWVDGKLRMSWGGATSEREETA